MKRIVRWFRRILKHLRERLIEEEYRVRRSGLVILLMVVVLSGCAPSDLRINLLPRRVFQLTTAGEPAGNICWMLPFENYRTSMEYAGYINVYDSRCSGWMRR